MKRYMVLVDEKSMSVSDEVFNQIAEILCSHKKRVRSGETLRMEEDVFEVEVEGGEIWIHPREDGGMVEIHLISDSPRAHSDYTETDACVGRKVRAILLNDVGDVDFFIPFFGNERMTYRVDFSTGRSQ